MDFGCHVSVCRWTELASSPVCACRVAVFPCCRVAVRELTRLSQNFTDLFISNATFFQRLIKFSGFIIYKVTWFKVQANYWKPQRSL